MMRVSELLNYREEKLTARAEETTRYADRLDATAAVVDGQADDVARAWPDQDGETAVAMLRAQATSLRDEAGRLRKPAPILTRAAADIQTAKSNVTQALATDQANRYLQSDDAGRVGYTAAFGQLPEARRNEQYENRTHLEHAFFTALQMATRADEDATRALLALIGQSPLFPPRPDTGPVDLSDEAIRDQLANSHQGQFSDCYFLTALAAIANANPQLVRDRITFNPATGCYTVTIFDNAGLGVIKRQIEVDPNDLQRQDGAKTPEHTPNFLSVYEAAYRKSLHGSVFTRTGGTTSAAMLAITGEEADFTVARPSSFDQIRKTLDSRPPGAVAVGTNPGIWPWPDPKDVPAENRLCPKHAYWVKGFDEQGRIVLVNPWGPEAGAWEGVNYAGEVHLSEDDFRRYTTQTARTVP